MGSKTIKKILAAAFAAAALITVLGVSAFFQRAERAVSDQWYQKRQAADGEIILIGIDRKALEEIGPFQSWGRDIMAMVLEALNASEDSRPAVIGIDVLYAGETEGDKDQWLAQAAGRYDNVVTACAAEFGSKLEVKPDGLFSVNDFAVLSYDEPYEELKKATTQGHINAMYDSDGVLRHCLLKLSLPDGREIPSFSMRIAERYREYHGEGLAALPPTDERGFWYLPYTGLPGDYNESISVADLLSGEAPEDYFAGKIVLIGPYAAGLQDHVITAIDHAQPMYGVEYQANAIQALLRGEYKKEAGNTSQLILQFIILLLCALGFWRRPVKVASALWLAVAGGWLLLCKFFYSRGLVLHVLLIPLGITVFYVACIVYNYVGSVLEKRRVTSRFKHYVAPEIVNEILKEGTDSLELGGKLTNIAVLFVDVRGFTPMSEFLDPVQVVEIINQYLSLIASSIMENGGTLDKFMGDAAMAFWGAPILQEDYVMKAVRAADDMVKGSRELSEKLEATYGRKLAFGIGIHMGEAVVGNIGSSQRMDYTAIGDTVNTASRLESSAPGGAIYISRAVADCLGDRIKTTSLGSGIKLKGKTEGFEILTLDGIAD